MLRKKFRDAEKEMAKNDFVIDSDGQALINVKAIDSDNLFSQYNYESNEKLNPGLSEFVWDKAKFVPADKDIRIKIFTEVDADEQEIRDAIKNNYKKDYIEEKNKIKKNLVFSVVMLLLGMAFMSLLLLMHKVYYNVYVEILLEIATWVFLWEAVDSFFLQRAQIRRRKLILMKLYCADIQVIKLKDINKLEKETNVEIK